MSPIDEYILSNLYGLKTKMKVIDFHYGLKDLSNLKKRKDYSALEIKCRYYIKISELVFRFHRYKIFKGGFPFFPQPY